MKKSTQILFLTLLIPFNFLNAQHATVTNIKINVVYIGIDNPIHVAVSGYSADDLTVQVSDGEIQGSSGKYIWKASTPGNAEITVFAKGKPSKPSSIESNAFLIQSQLSEDKCQARYLQRP